MKLLPTVLCCILVAGAAVAAPDRPSALPRGSVEVGKIDAVVTKRVLPTYPHAMLRMQIEGNVALEITVNPEGKVVDVVTLHATDQTFASEARRAVRQWEFARTEKMSAGEPVRFLLPIEFRLRRG